MRGNVEPVKTRFELVAPSGKVTKPTYRTDTERDITPVKENRNSYTKWPNENERERLHRQQQQHR